MKLYVCVESPKYKRSRIRRGSRVYPTMRRVGSEVVGYGPFDNEDEARIWAAWTGIRNYTFGPCDRIVTVHK